MLSHTMPSNRLGLVVEHPAQGKLAFGDWMLFNVAMEAMAHLYWFMIDDLPIEDGDST